MTASGRSARTWAEHGSAGWPDEICPQQTGTEALFQAAVYAGQRFTLGPLADSPPTGRV